MRIFGLGTPELLIILVVVLLLFGPKQIPKLSKMFGRAMRDVREGLEGKDDVEETSEQAAIPAAPKGDSVTEESKKKEDAAV